MKIKIYHYFPCSGRDTGEDSASEDSDDEDDDYVPEGMFFFTMFHKASFLPPSAPPVISACVRKAGIHD